MSRSVLACVLFGGLSIAAVAQPHLGTVPAPTLARPFETRLLSERFEVATNGIATETVHIQVTANNAAAAQQIGQQPIVYSETLSELEIVDAFTLKADGRKIPVAASAVYTQLPQGASQMPMFDDLRQKVVVFPELEAGDSIDLTFRRHDKRAVIPGQFMFEQSFSRLAPFDNVDVTVIAPKTYPLYSETHEVQFNRSESGSDDTYHWHYSAPATLESDDSLLSSFDRSPRFLISSFKDYDGLARAVARLVAPSSKVSPKIQARADEITQGVADRKVQARKLYEWVSRHIRYVGIEIGAGAIVPHDADTVLANGYGDCKDHVVLYSALLKAKGIASEFVLINLGNAYALPATAVLGELNHAITWLPEFGTFADTTAGVIPFGSLPFQEYGKPIVVAEESGKSRRQIPVLPPGLASVVTNTLAKLDASGKITGTSTITASGPFSGLLRQIGLGIEAVGVDRAANEILRSANADGTGTFNLSPPNELAPSYTIGSSWSFGPYAEIAQGRRFAMPLGIAVLGVPGDNLVGPLFSAKSTDSEPIPCFSGHAEENITLQAPPGRHFLESPPDASIRTTHIAFSTHWSLVADTLHLHREFTSTVDAALCSGATRTETASALAAIRQTYAYGAALAPASSGKPMASLDTLRVAHDQNGIGDASATQQLYAYARATPDVPANLVATLYATGGGTQPSSEYLRALSNSDSDPPRNASLSGPAQLAELEKHGNLSRAERILSDAIKADIKSAALYDQRGIVRDDRSHFDGAVTDFTRAIALASSPIEASRYYTDRAVSYWMARDFRPALRDFSAAISCDDSNALAYEGRGRSELFAGRLGEARSDFKKATDLHKGDVYAALWLYIAESRAGKNARADISERTAGWNIADWPGPMLRLYRGDSESGALATSSLTKTLATERETNEQEFFLAEFKLLNGDRAGAIAHFRAALAANVPAYTEFVAAGIELERLTR